ncbi:hypothetical protein Slin15195_G129100 [Septoria linicola]|uniref:Uncharacterized protein n=1 Tax=Septoria linicola TaxID=215465 RepID=A0A9Q9BAY1_9PEZI|nr:hypothetical protein Slin14017_G121630 [Septoria linicola]USW59591.1 hypothetical protein Slin15195_G129100 [Septoria linicola]
MTLRSSVARHERRTTGPPPPPRGGGKGGKQPMDKPVLPESDSKTDDVNDSQVCTDPNCGKRKKIRCFKKTPSSKPFKTCNKCRTRKSKAATKATTKASSSSQSSPPLPHYTPCSGYAPLAPLPESSFNTQHASPMQSPSSLPALAPGPLPSTPDQPGQLQALSTRFGMVVGPRGTAAPDTATGQMESSTPDSTADHRFQQPQLQNLSSQFGVPARPGFGTAPAALGARTGVSHIGPLPDWSPSK